MNQKVTQPALTAHASRRMRQRGLPPLILDWLYAFGEEQHDGHGGVVLYFNKQARRRIERSVGRNAVRRLADWLNTYAVVSSDGKVVTAGYRYRRIKH